MSLVQVHHVFVYCSTKAPVFTSLLLNIICFRCAYTIIICPVSSISPTTLATHWTAQVTTPTTQINADVDSRSKYIVIKDH